MAKTITTKDILEESRASLSNSEAQKRSLRQHYASEEKVIMYLSPMYAPHFGKNMRVTINGVTIFFPVDGSTHSIPTTFADEITRRRMSIDNILNKQNLMANVSGNMERTPGELSIF